MESVLFITFGKYRLRFTGVIGSTGGEAAQAVVCFLERKMIGL